jgi:hypothetical protein
MSLKFNAKCFPQFSYFIFMTIGLAPGSHHFQFASHSFTTSFGFWYEPSSTPSKAKIKGVSRSRESHPQPLSELYVNLSAHTAPIILPPASNHIANEQIDFYSHWQFYLEGV